MSIVVGFNVIVLAVANVVILRFPHDFCYDFKSCCSAMLYPTNTIDRYFCLF